MDRIFAILAALPFLLALILAPGLEPWDAGIVLVASGLVAIVLAARVRGGGYNAWAMLPLLLVAAYFAWRALSSPVADFGRRDLLLVVGGVLGFATTLTARRAWFGPWLVVLALFGLASVAVAGWQQFVDPGFSPLYGRRLSETFPSGFSGHYNHFANVTAALSVLLFGFAFAGKLDGLTRGLALVGATLLGGGAILSQSRGGVIAWLVGLVVVGFASALAIHASRPKLGKGLLLGLLALLPVAAIAVAVALPKMLAARAQGAEGVNLSDGGRFDYWFIALDAFGEAPWLGSGARSFSYRNFDFWSDSELWRGTNDIDMVHNELLQVLVDYGMVGALLLLGLVGFALLRGVGHLILGGEDERGLTAGAFAGVAVMLVQSMFSFTFHTLPDVILFGALLGILLRQRLEGQQPVPLSKRLQPQLLLILGGALALVASASDARAWLALHGHAVPLHMAPPEVIYARTSEAVRVRPDHELFFRKATLEGAEAELRQDQSAHPWAQRAVESLQAGLERHPWDYAAMVNLARLLDALGRFDESAKYYDRMIPVLDPREIHYQVHLSLARHWYLRGLARWRRTGFAKDLPRSPGEALACFEEAERQLQRSRQLHGPVRSAAARALRESIERHIEALRAGKVEPVAIEPIE